MSGDHSQKKSRLYRLWVFWWKIYRLFGGVDVLMIIIQCCCCCCCYCWLETNSVCEIIVTKAKESTEKWSDFMCVNVCLCHYFICIPLSACIEYVFIELLLLDGHSSIFCVCVNDSIFLNLFSLLWLCAVIHFIRCISFDTLFNTVNIFDT